MTPRLLLLGAPARVDAAGTTALPWERRTQLLAVLALRAAWVARGELAALLWPELVERLALANLRKILFRLPLLDWRPELRAEGGALRFAADTDVADFHAALQAGRHGEAIALWRGELLAGFDDDANPAWTTWLQFERDRLRVAWRGAVLRHLEGAADPAEAVVRSARLLEADPLDEVALRVHLDGLARSGQGARALQAYRAFRERLQQELGLPPGAATEAIHDRLAAGERAAAPVRPAPVAAARELRDDGFVGRAVERRRIAELLAGDAARVLTLLGPGGVGKTRLARQVAADLREQFPGGVVELGLDDLPEGSALGARLAAAFGLRADDRRDPLDQVAEAVGSRRVLLVLDNLEHLPAEAPKLQVLVERAPGLVLLATSRARLGLAAERVLVVDGLPFPEPEDEDRAEAFDAVRLFVQTALQVAPGLEPAAERAAIVEICRLVEGLPLAIEIAAGWARLLPCAAIAAGLRADAELLRAVDPARPARHASMEVVFEQSWRRLSAVEAAALRRLSVFRGGFTAAAARAVAGAALPVLGALVDRSLLRRGTDRFAMHPLVQQLAAARLVDEDERRAAAGAHAAWMLRQLGQLRRALENADRDALQQLDDDQENCRAACRWWVAGGDTRAIDAAAPALFFHADHRGRYREGLELIEELLGATAGEPRLRGRLLAQVAHLAYRLDRYADAEAAAAQALALARAARDAPTEATGLQVQASCALRLGRPAEAARDFRRAQRLAIVAADPRKAAAMVLNRAVAERALGRSDEAIRLYGEAIARQRTLGDVAGEALCLANLGILYESRGDLGAAAAHLRAGLAICQRHGLVNTESVIVLNLAGVERRGGELGDAQAHAERALELALATGNRTVAAVARCQLTLLAVARGDRAAARARLDEVLPAALAVGTPAVLGDAARCYAEVIAAEGQVVAARRILGFVAGLPAVHPDERSDLRARLAQLPAADGGAAWPGLSLEQLVHRAAIEGEARQASLLAEILGARA